MLRKNRFLCQETKNWTEMIVLPPTLYKKNSHIYRQGLNIRSVEVIRGTLFGHMTTNLCKNSFTYGYIFFSFSPDGLRVSVTESHALVIKDVGYSDAGRTKSNKTK
jgi:hypothetical protein